MFVWLPSGGFFRTMTDNSYFRMTFGHTSFYHFHKFTYTYITNVIGDLVTKVTYELLYNLRLYFHPSFMTYPSGLNVVSDLVDFLTWFVYFVTKVCNLFFVFIRISLSFVFVVPNTNKRWIKDLSSYVVNLPP